MKKGFAVFLCVLGAMAAYVVYTQVDTGDEGYYYTSPQKGEIKNVLELSGEVQAMQMEEITTKSGGEVSSVLVSEGQTVKKGDVLYTFSTEEVDGEIKEQTEKLNELQKEEEDTKEVSSGAAQITALSPQAQNALALAQSSSYELASYNNSILSVFGQNAADNIVAAAGIDIESIIDSYFPGYGEVYETFAQNADISVIEDIVPQSEIADGVSRIESVKDKIKQLEKEREALYVKSDIDGVVLSLAAKEGAVLGAGEKGAVIADMDNMKIDAMVSEREVKKLLPGMKAKLISGSGSKNTEGKISRIGNIVESGNVLTSENLVSLTVTPNEKINELVGSDMGIEIVTEQKKNVLVLGLECFLDENTVFVVNDNGVAEKRSVMVGSRDNYNAEILSGIKSGEKVVCNPGEEIEEGKKVKLIDRAA